MYILCSPNLNQRRKWRIVTQCLIHAPPLIDNQFKLIKTSGYQVCEKHYENPGIKIVSLQGPKGTGKSTAGVFLQVYKQDTPVMVLNHRTFDPLLAKYSWGYLTDFIQSHCNGCVPDNVDHQLQDLILWIIETVPTGKEIQRPILFVDLGVLMSSSNSNESLVPILLEFVANASRNEWFVVVAYSGGGLFKLVKKYYHVYQHILLRSENIFLSDFTDDEATVFIDTYNVVEFAKRYRNPWLLSCYRNEKNYSSNSIEENAEKVLHAYRKRIVDDVITLFKQNLGAVDCVQNSLPYLEYAYQGCPIPKSQAQLYKRTYIAMENLTVVVDDYDESSDCFQLRLHLNDPIDYYPRLIRRLRIETITDSALRSIPIIQGLVFGHDILHYSFPKLCICAVSVENDCVTNINFENIRGAPFQQEAPLTCINMRSQIYHLRIGHPTIDAVCFSEDTNKKGYLLLIQTSTSSYGSHPTKGQMIYSKVSKMEDSTGLSLAEYYVNLVKEGLNVEIPPSQVVYVYLSPNQILTLGHVELKSVYCLELGTYNTPNHPDRPRYLFGLVPKDSETALSITTVYEAINN